MDDREFERLVLPKLLEAAETPLDDNLIAAYVDGDLSKEGRKQVELHMQRDPGLKLHIEALQVETRQERRVLWPLVAMAAAVLVAVGVWQLMPGADIPQPKLGVRLAKLTAELRESDPETFGSFELMTDDELHSGSSTSRGGLAWTAPRGFLLEAPKTLHWKNAPGSEGVELRIKGRGVNWKQSITGEEVAAPTMGPGRYRVTIRSQDTLAGQDLRRSFVVASEQERALHASAIEALTRRADQDLLALLKAHYFLRLGAYEQARTHATEAAAGSAEIATRAQQLVQHLDAVAPTAE